MSGIEIVEDTFGIYPGESPVEVKRFTLTNKSGFSAQVINYGATLTSLKVPNAAGKLDDVVLGFDSIESYLGLNGDNPYFGATIGRSSNRIAKGQFTLDGENYQLSINNGENHLHGGINGFDKRMWEGRVVDSKVVFSYLSSDGQEGYPGDVLAQVTYEITDKNELTLQYQAICTKPCPVGLTNHSYFNLAGDTHTAEKLVGHFITINADNITPVDDNLIITGEIKPVQGTEFDLRTPTDLGKVLASFPPGPNGFDHNFCLNKPQSYTLAARLEERNSGRVLEVYTDQPGFQFYTCNQISETEPLVGKGGSLYYKHGAMCLETQNYPDAVNNPNFPNPILRPGGSYTHKVVYAFSNLA